VVSGEPGSVYTIWYILEEQLEYAWDETKNRLNIANHGFSFVTASRVFEDPYLVMEQDREVDGETRWQTIGMVDGIHMLLVAHTTHEDEEVIEIISARRANAHERRRYARGN
jgi:uncharacterized DUF497 family protein